MNNNKVKIKINDEENDVEMILDQNGLAYFKLKFENEN